MKFYLKRMRGGHQSPPRKPFIKIVWSWLGAFLGIYLIAAMGNWLSIENQIFAIGSFGASAVLIYGAPLAEFSQPRNLMGGHIISAIVGVTVFHFLSPYISLPVTSALAVSLAIVAMHFTATLHPPGGATALIAVIGGARVHSLGYLYVLMPVGVGAFFMLIVALLVNNLSTNPKRHYPRYWI